MSKAQFIKKGTIHTGHQTAGGSSITTFDFKKIGGVICIIATYEDKDNKRFFQIEHSPMNDCIDALIEWLTENKCR